MINFRRVIIESPFRGKGLVRNVKYAKEAMRDSISRGEAPFLSHLLYPSVLDDLIEEERSLGIALGYAWWVAADAICFYCDLGWSDGMVDAKLAAGVLHIPIEERYIAKDIYQRNPS